MIRTALFALVSLSVAASASPTLAKAAPCRDAKGHFAKCPPAAARKTTVCRNAKGRFAKCGTPGAMPAK